MAHAPHCLFGHVDGAVNYSVGRYLEDAEATLRAAQRARTLPIFVGGTGLYFKALTQGLSDIPRVPEEIRAEVRARAEGRPVADLACRTWRACDPAAAERLRPSDPQRILRALEVFAATGQSLTVFQKLKQAPLLDAQQCLGIFLAPERKALRDAIDRRFEAMLAEGALDEVAALRERHLDPALPVMRAHGVPHLLAHLEGELSLAEAARLGKATHATMPSGSSPSRGINCRTFRWIAPEAAEAEVMAAIADRRAAS